MTIHELLALTGLTESDEIPVWDAEASGEPTKKITAQNLAAAVKTLANLLGTGDVVNDLTSTVTDKPLSAAQGKALKDNHQQKTFIELSALGLTSPSTIAAVYSALPTNSKFIQKKDVFSNGETPGIGVVEIVKADDVRSRGFIRFYGKLDTTGDYRMFINDSGVPTGTWKKYTLT